MYRCSRCGRPITIHEHVQNTRILKILSRQQVLHFCNCCVELIQREDKYAIYKRTCSKNSI